MSTTLNYTPKPGGLGEQLAASAIQSRDVSRPDQVGEKANPPRLSKTGGKLRQSPDEACEIGPEGDDTAATYRPSKGKRKSRAKETGSGVQSLLDAAVHDWFQGVIPNGSGSGTCFVGGEEERRGIQEAYEFLSDIGLCAGKPGSGGRGYSTGLPFYIGRTGTDQVASITSGSRTGGMPNLCVTGGHGLCAEVAPLIKERWPGFLLTRADVAIDIQDSDDPELIERLLDMSRAFCKGRKMQPPETRGMDTPDKGRTFYVGNRTDGDVFLRVYEKGKQLRGEKGIEDAPEGWVRIEFVMKNIDGDLKAEFGQLSPGDMIRTKIWPRLWLAQAAVILGASKRVEHVAPIRLRRGADAGDARQTVMHGSYQYAGAFARVAHDEIIAEREEREARDPSQPVERGISRAHLVRKMGAIFMRELQGMEDRLDQVCERYGIGTYETVEDRAMSAASRMQSERVREARLRVAATATVAKAVRHGDSDDIAAVLASLEHRKGTLDGMLNVELGEAQFIQERRRKREEEARKAYWKKRGRGRKWRMAA
jgi:hypothetical protein